MRRPVFSACAAAIAFFSFSGALGAARDQAAKPPAGTAAPKAVDIAPRELAGGQDGDSLISIPTPGRYSIRAKNASGARIELVDMIAGPLDSSDSDGVRDSRIDALLDKGVYKLRVKARKNASGKTALSALPFVEAEPGAPTLAAGKVLSGELGDLQRRSYALETAAEGPVAIEAIGRALQDLRVWNAEGELVDLAFERAAAETRPGRFMTRLRLQGALAPGRYVVTAYGGEPLTWGDGAKAQPFLIRLDTPALLAAGAAQGVIDAFGIARFEAPASYDSFRLDLPQQASAAIEARRGASRQMAAIDKKSRQPAVVLRLGGDGKTAAQLEVTGYEGQAFALSALRQSNYETFRGAGPHLVFLDLAGEGGDEAPATALFARLDTDGKARVIASDAPRIGAGAPWRGKFNLFGPTSILFEAAQDGPVAIEAKGVALDAAIEPALGQLAPTADGKDKTRYDLQAGFYFLKLTPKEGAAGVVDVQLGPPGLGAPPPAPAPARAQISFGAQNLEGDGAYLILANVAPQLLTGPRVVALPAELAKAPLALRQDAGREIALPVRIPQKGRIVARDDGNAVIGTTLLDEKIEAEQRLATLKIAAPTASRAIGLVFVPEAAPEEKNEAETTQKGKPLAFAVGRPAFFDLARDETRRARFEVAQGGLYRVETLGRMKTALRIGAVVSPNLGQGDANGPGANGLVTTFLRAGAYRAAVTAEESAGHLGLSVAPAALAAAAKIVDEGVARATLRPGEGAAIPFDITRAGEYRLDLLGLAHDWRARLEDAEGWPLAAPGTLKTLTQHFDPGAYRLVVSPEDVEGRVVARLAPVPAPPALEGHGPHALPFEAAQKLQWREPQGKDAPRAPDVWRFALHGDADVELSIGEGMIGEIFKGDESVGRTAGDRPFKGKLGAGDYRVEARSLAHDDRLDYEISLSSKQLQPGATRRVDLPAQLEFSLAADGIVDISGFGDIETIGVLKTASGEAVERLEPRPDDWNLALSRRLPAGAYRLELEELGAGLGSSAQEEASSEESSDQSEAQDGEGADGETEPSGVEIRLALPAEKDEGALEAKGGTRLSGASAHALRLAPTPEGSLALVAARSEADVALAVERREGDAWRLIGMDRGRAPAVAWPAGRDKAELRVLLWPLGDAQAQIDVVARVVEGRGRAPGEVAMEPVEGTSLCAAKVATPDAALVTAAFAGKFAAGSTPGEALRWRERGPLAPQSQSLWLVARGDCKAPLRIDAFAWRGEEVALDLQEGERVRLPALAPPKNKTRLWLARSSLAQPALDAGAGMGVAKGAALAFAAGKEPLLWNADPGASMRAALRAIDLDTREPVSAGALYAGVIPPMSVQPVDLEKSQTALALDLGPGLAAFAGGTGVFGDGAAVSRVAAGADRVWLANLSAEPAPARIARATGETTKLAPGALLRRFFPAAGERALLLEAKPGDRLVVLGAEATFVSQSGRIARGRDIALDGPGEAVLAFSPGLVVAWIERDGKTPWPQAQTVALTPPQRVRLEGAAMRFSVKLDTPALISATGGAPALAALTQNGRRETFAFASGVDLHHYAAAGETTLEIAAAHDGGALSGTLEISAQPAIEAHEGVNDPVAVSPGSSALFTFVTKRDGDIGVGLRAEPDRIFARLLDAEGKTVAEGVAMMKKLPPGRWFLEARAPSDAGATTIRAAILGLSPPPAAPPDEVVAALLEKAGMKKGGRK
ncbi:hypothetical protein [Methylocystis heyeri]|uniref:Alpha-2-macroglobulin family protein n=1 Tax=Methylocystis heyeri TaxID=391905 RepID=A0A6B8KGM1_9HYPH|nr:hypothetical protein [Methylocystis heyeri]QGM46769.1 hypothetical protein H2LOC_014295 [Methylocystis heyeri]